MSGPHARTRELAGVALMVLANVLFAFNDGWVRRIADDLGTVETVWGRSIIFLAIIALAMRRKDWRAMVDAPKPHLQIVRGIFPVVAAFLMIEAMGRIPVADATATFFISPLITVLLAIPLLGERIGPGKWLALALGFAGMLVIVRPGTGALDWAHLFALATALIVAFYQIFTALVTRTSSAKTTLFFMAATATVITSCMVPFTWTRIDAVHWLHLAGVSIVYAAGHGMYIMAHARAEASKLAPFVYFQLIGSMVAGFVFYDQVPRLYTLLGAALIATGGCIALLRRQRGPSAP